MLFFIASMTYHGDFTWRDAKHVKILNQLSPKNMFKTVEECRKFAVYIYEALYNYSDKKIEDVFEYKSLKVLFKYFVDHSDQVDYLWKDPKKREHLEHFYSWC